MSHQRLGHGKPYPARWAGVTDPIDVAGPTSFSLLSFFLPLLRSRAIWSRYRRVHVLICGPPRVASSSVPPPSPGVGPYFGGRRAWAHLAVCGGGSTATPSSNAYGGRPHAPVLPSSVVQGILVLWLICSWIVWYARVSNFEDSLSATILCVDWYDWERRFCLLNFLDADRM